MSSGSFDVVLVAARELVLVTVLVTVAGGEVMVVGVLVWCFFFLSSSQQPKNIPGVLQTSSVVEVWVGVVLVLNVVVVPQSSPNHPCLQDVVVAEFDAVVAAVVVEVVGARVVVVMVVFAASLQPNQPGVRQVVVVYVVVMMGVDEVELGSRHPHHPGVLQVVVRVYVGTTFFVVVVVIGSEPLLSKNFHL